MQVSIVHDEFGQIVSVNRPSEPYKVVVLSDSRQFVFVADVSDDQMDNLIGGYRVDINNKVLVNRPGPFSAPSSQ
jgi:hypothetical protein